MPRGADRTGRARQACSRPGERTVCGSSGGRATCAEEKHRRTVQVSRAGETKVPNAWGAGEGLEDRLEWGSGQGPTGENARTLGGQRAQEFPVRRCPAQSEAGLSVGRDGGQGGPHGTRREPPALWGRAHPLPTQVLTQLSEELPYTGAGWGQGPPPGSTAGPGGQTCLGLPLFFLLGLPSPILMSLPRPEVPQGGLPNQA